MAIYDEELHTIVFLINNTAVETALEPLKNIQWEIKPINQAPKQSIEPKKDTEA